VDVAGEVGGMARIEAQGRGGQVACLLVHSSGLQRGPEPARRQHQSTGRLQALRRCPGEHRRLATDFRRVETGTRLERDQVVVAWFRPRGRCHADHIGRPIQVHR
jgi:hypothetical protein